MSLKKAMNFEMIKTTYLVRLAHGLSLRQAKKVKLAVGDSLIEFFQIFIVKPTA